MSSKLKANWNGFATGYRKFHFSAIGWCKLKRLGNTALKRPIDIKIWCLDVLLA